MVRHFSFITLFLISTLGIGQTINQIGYYNKNGIFGLDAKANYMILSNGEIIDNTSPSLPVLISQYSFSGDGSIVMADNDYAYFGTGMTNDLFIADISNISFPLHKSSIDFTIGNGVFGMDISENTLFVALGQDGIICSIDITDKDNPIMLDTLFMSGGQCRDVVLQNNYAFAAHAGGLKIIDIANSSDLQLISSIGSGYNSIDISENLVFLGKSSGGIDVFEISDPANPLPAFSIPNTGGTAWDLRYHLNHLYLATNSEGLYIYKIEENAGVEMANFPNTGNGQSFGVCLQDSLVLLSGLINGVAILQYDSTGTVNIKTISKTRQINIFPNPAQDYVMIESGNLHLNQIKIFDINGRLLKQISPKSSSYGIDISDLPKGQYLFSFETSDKRFQKRIIKVE